MAARVWNTAEMDRRQTELRAVLDAHYAAHPDARPHLAEIALAAAELDGNPLASRPELIRRAATDVVLLKDDPTPDDVLHYAAGISASTADREGGAEALPH